MPRTPRLCRHFAGISKPPFWVWGVELTILLLEIIGIGEGYETVSEWLKPRTRPLNAQELEIAQSVFGNALQYERILIDETARIGCKKGNHAYVSWYIINNWGALRADIFVHELVHIWQYEQIGARYMSRALQAQTSESGYNYGGIEMLKKHQKIGLRAFNMEQQADIVCDYFRIKNGLQPQWSLATRHDLPIYEGYVAGFS